MHVNTKCYHGHGICAAQEHCVLLKCTTGRENRTWLLCATMSLTDRELHEWSVTDWEEQRRSAVPLQSGKLVINCGQREFVLRRDCSVIHSANGRISGITNHQQIQRETNSKMFTTED